MYIHILRIENELGSKVLQLSWKTLFFAGSEKSPQKWRIINLQKNAQEARIVNCLSRKNPRFDDENNTVQKSIFSCFVGFHAARFQGFFQMNFPRGFLAR